MVKFSSKMDAEVLESLRSVAREQGRTLASVLSEAGRHYLRVVRVRPAFRQSAENVMDRHSELLTRLAK